jgi:hypothetical protein
MENIHETILELIQLREKRDLDAIIDKLYDALASDLKNSLNFITLFDWNREAILIMINHFLQKEEYEKCAVLKMLLKNNT